jgi:hypothetical protein
VCVVVAFMQFGDDNNNVLRQCCKLYLQRLWGHEISARELQQCFYFVETCATAIRLVMTAV